ncbi:MAG: class I SAM-dependent methyltransferase [Acidobacteriia bacterium]|nr:class I SAM-dependent methyltransferase [Terriglobia bacterium]
MMLESASILRFKSATPPAAPMNLPQITDLTGYEVLVERIHREGLDRLNGDFLEIGCFLGGGTAKLAKVAASAGKRVWVIDLFDPAFDLTKNLAGDAMADLYRRFLNGCTQEQVFQEVTRPWARAIRVLREDSMKVKLPEDLRLAFAFVDGNHDPAWVRSDFKLVWDRLLPGGWAGFHDYRDDLPEVTAMLDSLLALHQDEIGQIETVPSRWILLVQKRPILPAVS